MGLKDEAIGSSQESAIGSQESEVVDPTPPEEWMVEQRQAAKRAEEKMAAGCDGELFVAKRPKAARQIVMKEAGATPEVAKVAGPRTKLVPVKQSYIDRIMTRPRPPFVGLSQELIDKCSDPALREELRALQAQGAAIWKQARDEEDGIIEQYRTKGYAMEEVEITEEEMGIATA